MTTPVITIDTPEHIKVAGGGRLARSKCRFTRYDSVSDMIEDAARLHCANSDTVNATKFGNKNLVAQSDALMAKFERFDLMAPRRAWVDDVAGAIPNVQAHISGHPMSMRRKTRVDTAYSPLAIVMELTGSAGLMETFSARGAAYLALGRLLSARRPVELWVSITFSIDHDTGMGAIFAKLPTDPLDVAVAANALISQQFLSAFASLTNSRLGARAAWAFGFPALERLNPEITYKVMFPHVTDLVVFPASYLFDVAAKDPEQWVKNQLAKLAGERGEAA